MNAVQLSNNQAMQAFIFEDQVETETLSLGIATDLAANRVPNLEEYQRFLTKGGSHG